MSASRDRGLSTQRERVHAEVLIIGCGSSTPHPASLNTEVRDYFRSQGVVLELMNTVREFMITQPKHECHQRSFQVNACATFNILNAEDRDVALATLTDGAYIRE